MRSDDPRVERKADGRRQQRSSVVVAEAVDFECGQAGQLGQRVTGGEEQRDGSAKRRRATKPSVWADSLSSHWALVDHTDQRLSSGRGRQEAQHR